MLPSSTLRWSVSACGTIFWQSPRRTRNSSDLPARIYTPRRPHWPRRGASRRPRCRSPELEKRASAVDAGHDRVKAALAVAVLTVQARMAVAENKPDEAIGMLREAAEKEDRLAYSEPADWFFPVRHLLGPVLMQTGRAAG